MYQLIVVYNKQYLPRIYSYFTLQGKPSTYIRIFFVYTLQDAHQLFVFIKRKTHQQNIITGRVERHG